MAVPIDPEALTLLDNMDVERVNNIIVSEHFKITFQRQTVHSIIETYLFPFGGNYNDDETDNDDDDDDDDERANDDDDVGANDDRRQRRRQRLRRQLTTKNTPPVLGPCWMKRSTSQTRSTLFLQLCVFHVMWKTRCSSAIEQ